MSKAQDRLKALQQRAGSYTAPARPAEPQPDTPADGNAEALTAARAYFGVEPLDQLARDRAIEAIPIAQIAPDLDPERRQPRLLPPPEELLVDGQPAPAYTPLVAELLALGESLRERQLQPIIVYPGASADLPAARYLILVGHRRWTAAMLAGLETLNAVVVEPPDDVARVSAQYAENEDRADFSDMERAWALQQMKRALGDAPWEAVEARFRLSRSRRQDLLRLTALNEAQQREVARLRLSETQLRPLHTALRSGELDASHADRVLGRIVAPAADGTLAVDGPAIARLVAQLKRRAEGGRGAHPTPPSPQWLIALNDQLTRIEGSLKRAEKRVGELSEADAAALVARLISVSMRMAELAEGLTRDATGASDATDDTA